MSIWKMGKIHFKRLCAMMMVVFVIVSSVGINVTQVSAATKPKEVTTNRTSYTLNKGKTVTLKATINTNYKGKIVWSSSNTKVATVTSKGIVKGIKNGTATITVKIKGSKNKATCKVTVKTPPTKVTLNKTSTTIKIGEKLTLKGTVSPKTASNQILEFSSSNKSVATVTSKGIIKGIKNGTATITVKIKGTKIKATCKVTVKTPATKITLDKTSATIKVGETVTINGTISPKTASDQTLEFSSSNESVATVSSEGVIQGIKVGAASITVKIKNTKLSGTCAVTVIEEKKKDEVVDTPTNDPVVIARQIILNKSEITLNEAATDRIIATVYPENATNKTVVFKSSNSEVVTVDTGGNVTAIKEGNATITATVQGTAVSANCNVVVKKEEVKLSYDGYNLEWWDEFEGTSLNGKDWNVETHEPGWVNNELQEYVDSEQNIAVKDGNLVIKPIKTVDEQGRVSYTSGRVNTQNKHDYTYGLFEVRAKVPAGQGYLPAFWMMPTDENIYGQWPRCGEIDIMEVMGQETDKLYGTIHYGNPHSESQGTHLLTEDNFADNFHTFSCEWEPGKISWYIDGVLYHEESDWYSATVGQGTITYPAPFDQPFYMILNLAVGGNWVGNPDATTDFKNAAFVIDSVKAYQKDSYDENVTKPIKEVVLRDPDANGNYVNNGDFATVEELKDALNWVSMTALGGEATASISDNAIKIATTNAGTVDYSVQLVQAGIPFEKGATYTVSFDASASDSRTMKTSIKAPDHGYSEYMTSKTVDLTTDKKSYSYDFKMDRDSDANGRLEFNMGAAGSTADIFISNVSIKKTKQADPNEKEVKTILADGNYVYNGSFQEGLSRLGYWEITNPMNASVLVTNENMDRRLKVEVSSEEAKAEDVLVAQSDLAIQAGKVYALSFDAQADTARDMKIIVAGQEVTANLTTGKKSYSFKITMPETLDKTNITFYMGAKGTTYLDNIRLVEDAMIKNGSFNAGFAGYEWFADSSADASSVVDSLTGDNAADITIKNTGDADWKIQLKQNNVELEKGQWYKLTFKAKSSVARKIRVIMQGLEAKGWAVYSGENIVSLTDEYQTFEKEFMMTADTDPQAFLCIALGAVGGEEITTQHRVCIDDIRLVTIEAPENPRVEVGVNILKNPDFTSPEGSMTAWTETIATWDNADATRAISGGAITYTVTKPGIADYNVQLKQSGLSLEGGKTYKVEFDVISTASREIKSGVMSTTSWYGGSDIVLVGNTSKKVEYTFTMNAVDPAADFYISMGKIEGIETLASAITISNLSFMKVD